jgi:hypothetical protein
VTGSHTYASTGTPAISVTINDVGGASVPATGKANIGDATYLQSPYEQPVTGLDAIRRMWEDEREGPDEFFTLATDILAVDGPTAVVRYGDPLRQEYRDLWVIRLADDGRCTWFEEWPYWPGCSHAARDDLP